MEKTKVSQEELTKSLQYLEAFAKGQKPEEIEKSNEPSVEEEPNDELYQAHKNRLASLLDKAMAHKGYMEKIKKGEPLPDEAFEDLDDGPAPEPAKEPEPEHEPKPKEAPEPEPEPAKEPVEKCGGGMKKGLEDELSKAEIQDLVKAQVDSALAEERKQTDAIIKGLRDELEQYKNEPIKKTILKGADAITLKKAFSGEKEDGKTLLSVSMQKAKVSEALYTAYEAEADSMTKSILGDAVAEFESTGSYISPEVLKIMDDKGYKFIK